jgi:GT2 family glycosyltransferase
MTELSHANFGVTLGIVAYRRAEAIAATLDRLRGSELDIVVVNVDRDPEVAQRVADADNDARLVEMDNRGYAAAVNAIAGHARGEVVVFANDDSRMTTSALLGLADVVARGDADVAVPRVVDDHDELERTITAVPSPRSLAREWLFLPDRPIVWLAGRVGVEKWRAPEVPERIDAAAAVVVAAHRDLLRIEPLPEQYFLYWEELEWFWHLRRRGALVQYRPEITCEHDGGRDDVRPQKSRLLARNAVRCVRRTQGRAAAAAALPVVIAWNLRLVLGDGVQLVVHRDVRHRERLRARCAGLWAALTSWTELR